MSSREGRRRPRLLVFDWDGTLLDSVGSIVACTQETMRQLGRAEVAEDDIRGAIGLGLRETVERFAPNCDEETFRLIVEVYREHWFATYSLQAEPFPGTRDFLGRLATAGYLLALATAKSRSGLEADFERSGLREFFLTTRTADETQSKPHPQMLLEVIADLGVGKDESLMIGDTVHDSQMAANAKVGFVAVCSGSVSRQELESHRPLACLDGVLSLEVWLAERGASVEVMN